MKQRRIFFGLLGLLAVMTGLSYWDEWNTAIQFKKAASENLVFAELDTIVGLDIVHHPGEALKLTAHDGGWFIEAPIQAAAEDQLVSQIVNTLTLYKAGKRIPNASLAPEYGLTAPVMTVTLRDLRGHVQSIKIGSMTPTGYSLYFQQGENPDVFVGSAFLQLTLNRTAAEIRAKTLMVIHPETLVTLDIERHGETAIQVQKTSDGFQLGDGSLRKLDPTKVLGFIEELNVLRAEAFIDAPVEPSIKGLFAAGNPSHRVIWKEQSGATHTLSLVLGPENTYLASFDPDALVYKVPLTFASVLTKNADDFGM